MVVNPISIDDADKTWDDAVSRWLVEKADKASLHSDICILRWLEPHLRGKLISEISRAVVDSLRTRKLATGVKHGTVNRMLALVRSILVRASVDWEWVEHVPKVRLLREPKRRVRFLLRHEAESLLMALPVHLSAMAAFSLATGLRKGNVLGLQWSQVDMRRRVAWIHPDQSKSRKAFAVPLNDDAMRLLSLQHGVHAAFVFTFKGKPVRQTTTAAWYKALRRCGIKNFRWHDLRHTWASWHVQGGTPLYVLQELGGWESEQMVRRYAHLSAGHLAEFADRLPPLMRGGETGGGAAGY
jgi:integrase